MQGVGSSSHSALGSLLIYIKRKPREIKNKNELLPGLEAPLGEFNQEPSAFESQPRLARGVCSAHPR